MPNIGVHIFKKHKMRSFGYSVQRLIMALVCMEKLQTKIKKCSKNAAKSPKSWLVSIARIVVEFGRGQNVHKFYNLTDEIF